MKKTDVENRRDFESFLPGPVNVALDPRSLARLDGTLRKRGLPGRKGTFEEFVIEEKYDGSLYVARLRAGSEVQFTSRRISAGTGRPVDRTLNFPAFMVCPEELAGTLLLGEIIAQTRRFRDTVSITGSSPENSWRVQEEIGCPDYIVFDCLWHCGKDVRSLPFAERKKLAGDAVERWRAFLRKNLNRDLALEAERIVRRGSWQRLMLSPLLRGAPEDAYREVVGRGGEGIMIKDVHAPYGEGVAKCKKVCDVSVVLTGYEEGKGKYAKMVGALKFSVYGEDGELVEVGQCSGMTDELRTDISTHRREYIGKVMDVACQPPDDPEEFEPGRDRLRHPRFLRFRPDLSPQQCTAAKLRRDLARFVAPRR